jgi:hypothetical protein
MIHQQQNWSETIHTTGVPVVVKRSTLAMEKFYHSDLLDRSLPKQHSNEFDEIHWSKIKISCWMERA